MRDGDPPPRQTGSGADRTTPLSLDIARYGAPKDRNQAFYSVPWVIAVGLIDGRTGLAQFDDTRLADPEPLKLCEKVVMSLHPDLENTGDPSQSVAGELVVRLRDGRELRHMRLRPRAYPRGEPWTRAQLEEKFREAALRSLPQPQVEESIAALDRLEKLSDIGELMRTLRPV